MIIVSFKALLLLYTLSMPLCASTLTSNSVARCVSNSNNHKSAMNNFIIPTNIKLSLDSRGRHYPVFSSQASELANTIIIIEDSIRCKHTSAKLLPILSHYQQVIYRSLSENEPLWLKVKLNLPQRILQIANLHILARKEFLNMSTNTLRAKVLPAWKIVKPEPPERLISYYLKAEQETGIDWEVLAAIHLVETGMGRIVGVSSANALGPMQFLQSTWDQDGIGNDGDINDSNDSIQAAARYLVFRGGLEDLKKGLWGYNNSNYYGNAVLYYAKLMKDDPLAFIGLYHWEIHFKSQEGDLWLPFGYEEKLKIPISTYLKKHPESAPPNYDSK